MAIGQYDRKQIKCIKFPDKNISEIQLSYAAGIIDGEGSIMVIHHNAGGKTGCKWEYWVLRLMIANNKKELIDWLLSMFGGGYSIGISKNPKWNDTYQWRVDSKHAKKVLELVYPYLLLKKKQAEIAIEMLKTYKLVGRKGHTKEVFDLRKKCAEDIKALNIRGKKVDTSL